VSLGNAINPPDETFPEGNACSSCGLFADDTEPCCDHEAERRHERVAGPRCGECGLTLNTSGDFGPAAVLALAFHYVREHYTALCRRLGEKDGGK
jgi:hypothetical protein